MAQLVEVTDPGDPLLADFAALNDPASRRVIERTGDYFVVEGTVAIGQLLALPTWQIRTLALLPRVAARLAAQLAGTSAVVAVADADVLRTVVGFDLHRGALASVQRRPHRPLADLVDPARQDLFVATEGVNDHENLGAIYRNAAAFGARGVLVDDTSADPFYRRSVRVSLGHVLRVPTAALGALPAGLDALHALGATTVALTPRASTDLRDITANASGPTVVVVGAEGPGLRPETIAAARRHASISMAGDVDSLNVATATAVALHHLSGRPGPS